MIQIIMSIATAPLPENYAALQAFAASLQLKYAELETGMDVLRLEIHHKTLHIEKLKAQLARQRKKMFGKSSEKLAREIEQTELMLGDLEEGMGAHRQKIESKTRLRSAAAKEQSSEPSAQRGLFPEHLPREQSSMMPPVYARLAEASA